MKKICIKNNILITSKQPSFSNYCKIIEDIEKELYVPLKHRSNFNIKEYEKKLFTKAHNLFCIDTTSNDTIGMVAYYVNKENKMIYISLIGIKKNYQNYGIGKMLLKNVEDKMDCTNINKIALEVFNKNERVTNFYKKNGYHIYKRDNTSLHMEKIIKKTN